MANKDTFWFRHDSNAKDDPKCILLIEQLGPEGYGIFWILIELLRDQPDYKYPLKLLPSIARRYNTSAEKIRTVISAYELFQVENETFFFSESLLERMKALECYKNALSKAGKRGAQARLKPPSSQAQATLKPGLSLAKRIEPNGIEPNGIEKNEIQNLVYDFSSNLTGLHIFVKESGLIVVKIFQQSFEKYLDGTFGPAYEAQKIALKKMPPIPEFFKKNNGNIYNDTSHLWSAFKKLWISNPNKYKLQ